MFRLAAAWRRFRTCSRKERPYFLCYPNWSNQEVDRSLKEGRMIALDAVSQKQEHPSTQERAGTPRPFHQDQQNDPGEDHGNAYPVQQLVPGGGVLVVVLSHIARQTRHSGTPLLGGQNPADAQLYPEMDEMARGARSEKNRLRKTSQVTTALHRFQHGDFVCVFQICANRNADADAGHANAERLQQFRNVDGRGLAFGRWIRG